VANKQTYSELEQILQNLGKELIALEERLQARTSKLRHLEKLLNTTNTPIFLKRLDFKYVFVNKEFELLSQTEAELVEGKDDFKVFPQSVAQLFRAQALLFE